MREVSSLEISPGSGPEEGDLSEFSGLEREVGGLATPETGSNGGSEHTKEVTPEAVKKAWDSLDKQGRWLTTCSLEDFDRFIGHYRRTRMKEVVNRIMGIRKLIETNDSRAALIPRDNPKDNN